MTYPEPPVAAKRPTLREHHGDVFEDPYEWLRDKESPEVVAHLEEENDFTEASTAHLEALRGRIFEEIKARTLETDLSVPVREGSHWYYSRSFEGKEYGVHCRAPISSPDDWTPPELDAETEVPGEEVLLDGNIESAGHDFFRIGSFDVSRDGAWLLYGVDTEGHERYLLRVRELSTGRELDDEIPGTFSGAIFSPDGRYVFYSTVDEAWRPDTIWRHEVGTPVSDDVVVHHEDDERFWGGIGLTRSGDYLVIGLGSSVTSEYRIAPASDPSAEFQVVWPRTEGVEYSIEHARVGAESVLLVLHNHGAPNFELVAVSPDAPGDGPADATVVVAHSTERRLEAVDAFANHLAFSYRRDGLTQVGTAVLGPDSALADITIDELAFDEPLYSVGFGGNPEWEQPTLRIGYGSFVTPSSVFDCDVRTGERALLKQQQVLGGYDASDYEQSREWATAEDGTRVPISLVWKKDGRTGPRPFLLYGYGSYESSIDPALSIARLSLLDRGAGFAIAHVRGGGELGRAWYEDGKLLSKKNSFTDFVACARHLVAEGITRPDTLVAEGGSAGGLLMGAVANLAPDAFAGIHAAVPFVDALTTILDPSLPLTVIEWDEWGDPLHDPEVYAYMKGYSPYENVREGVEYPHILATTSLNDTRVYYVEPAKWVARLREVGAPALLKTEMVAGHGGVSGRYAQWRERAFELAWILDVLVLEAA
ncbi:S9 family peptidase [Labedella populi]|uniref:S9 family peptidase n=1 Tax=Labedella populi TaxID=2498850 RepID=A0A3S3ZH92_9MICO|nr:S9 family peptidase [Labedella populi]RWZ55362.1 S9 family peptidase [Labedella populi]